MPYERPGTAQVKFKEEGKSQSTEEGHKTQKSQPIIERKIKKNPNFQFLQISTGLPKALLLHNSLKIQKRPWYE